MQNLESYPRPSIEKANKDLWTHSLAESYIAKPSLIRWCHKCETHVKKLGKGMIPQTTSYKMWGHDNWNYYNDGEFNNTVKTTSEITLPILLKKLPVLRSHSLSIRIHVLWSTKSDDLKAILQWSTVKLKGPGKF